jgi:hypothetical protein
MIRSLKGVAPLLHSCNDCQECPIIRAIVLFGTCAFSKLEVDQTENPKTDILVENADYGKAACISMQNIWLRHLEIVENSLLGEGPVQLPKRKFGIPSPLPFDLFR